MLCQVYYYPNLGLSSTGSAAVGSDSWLAAGFFTGDNASGYLLNSVQLGMADASGSPSDFMVMLYGPPTIPAAVVPGSSLGTLAGSLNPAIGGIYTYTASPNLVLSPSTYYFVVLTAGTAIANGAYEWSESAYPPSINDWGANNAVLHSSNGTSGWSPTPYLGIAQFAIDATDVPEPGILSLFVLGGLGFLWPRRKAGAV